jgi:hypothetical protein
MSTISRSEIDAAYAARNWSFINNNLDSKVMVDGGECYVSQYLSTLSEHNRKMWGTPKPSRFMDDNYPVQCMACDAFFYPTLGSDLWHLSRTTHFKHQMVWYLSPHCCPKCTPFIEEMAKEEHDTYGESSLYWMLNNGKPFRDACFLALAPAEGNLRYGFPVYSQ